MFNSQLCSINCVIVITLSVQVYCQEKDRQLEVVALCCHNDGLAISFRYEDPNDDKVFGIHEEVDRIYKEVCDNIIPKVNDYCAKKGIANIDRQKLLIAVELDARSFCHNCSRLEKWYRDHFGVSPHGLRFFDKGKNFGTQLDAVIQGIGTGMSSLNQKELSRSDNLVGKVVNALTRD